MKFEANSHSASFVNGALNLKIGDHIACQCVSFIINMQGKRILKALQRNSYIIELYLTVARSY